MNATHLANNFLPFEGQEMTGLRPENRIRIDTRAFRDDKRWMGVGATAKIGSAAPHLEPRFLRNCSISSFNSMSGSSCWAQRRDTYCSAPRAGPVRAATAPGAANHKGLKGLTALRVNSFWRSCVIGVVEGTGVTMCRLDAEQVVVGAERRINGRAPFPVNGDAGNVGAEGALPHHIAIHFSSSVRKRGWNTKRQTREEDFVASRDGNGSHPSVGQRVEGRACAGGAGRKGDPRIGDREVVRMVGVKLNCGVRETYGRSRTRDAAGSEIGVEPDVRAALNRRAVEIRSVGGLFRTPWRRGRNGATDIKRGAVIRGEDNRNGVLSN